jgi:hypothetical protein
MARACSTHEGEEEGFWWENQKVRHHQEDLEIGGRIILKWIVEKYDGVVWTGLIWHMIGTSGGLL